ncbi:MAG TPA: hypothetical protein VFS39_02130 [Nitrospira sp.]|nr:hypothetical protein [Nitrospira sp.]
MTVRLAIAAALLLVASAAGCSNVQVLKLTSETYPPRQVEDVAILSQEPSSSHTRIAELSETSSSDSIGTMQKHILKKAAELGADAVVFSTPITRTEERVAYQPTYNPWGYYSPYYYGPGPFGYWGGPYGYGYGAWGPGWGYRSAVPVPYAVRVTTLRGTAIRY